MIAHASILLRNMLCVVTLLRRLMYLVRPRLRSIKVRVDNDCSCSEYLAPEYAMRRYLTEKADVFGFGVALEITSGRANSDSSLEEDIYLLEWAVYYSLEPIHMKHFVSYS
ncbi:Protein kinase domain-containing protein [Forsythia ovata]|uniref:Protein kinase domain-containing protein n=1 Tax=Forsythia ovata TaxID=205694 RepID=A0ABD1S4W2_9LAMI